MPQQLVLSRNIHFGDLHTNLKSSIFLVCAIFFVVHCYRHPNYSIDLLSYIGNVAAMENTDPVAIHQKVYSNDLPAHLLGTDANNPEARILRRRAKDTYYSATFLPYFSVKPLYIIILQELHRTGLGIVSSIRLASSICYFGIGVIVWLCTRSVLSVFLLALPEIMVLGGANEPDALSTFFLLLGLWLLFVKNKDLGVLAVLMSVWVRPDNVIAAVITISAMLLHRRINLTYALLLATLAVGSYSVITHYGYGWRSLYAHTFLGAEPGALAQFGLGDYRDALARGLRQLWHSSALLYVALASICLSRSQESGTKKMLALAALFSVLRFAVFPSYEVRFYGLFFVSTGIAAICMVRDRLMALMTQAKENSVPQTATRTMAA